VDDRGGAAHAAGRRQSLFREVNERIEEAGESSAGLDEAISIVCECRRLECTERIELSHDEYEALRGYPTRFVLLPGHEDGLYGRIVEQHERYLTVEAVGEAATAAVRLDPRCRLPGSRAAGSA
jgi:hypothetical protein